MKNTAIRLAQTKDSYSSNSAAQSRESKDADQMWNFVEFLNNFSGLDEFILGMRLQILTPTVTTDLQYFHS